MGEVNAGARDRCGGLPNESFSYCACMSRLWKDFRELVRQEKNEFVKDQLDNLAGGFRNCHARDEKDKKSLKTKKGAGWQV